jgi:hypothetical protein
LSGSRAVAFADLGRLVREVEGLAGLGTGDQVEGLAVVGVEPVDGLAVAEGARDGVEQGPAPADPVEREFAG